MMKSAYEQAKYYHIHITKFVSNSLDVVYKYVTNVHFKYNIMVVCIRIL